MKELLPKDATELQLIMMALGVLMIEAGINENPAGEEIIDELIARTTKKKED